MRFFHQSCSPNGQFSMCNCIHSVKHYAECVWLPCRISRKWTLLYRNRCAPLCPESWWSRSWSCPRCYPLAVSGTAAAWSSSCGPSVGVRGAEMRGVEGLPLFNRPVGDTQTHKQDVTSCFLVHLISSVITGQSKVLHFQGRRSLKTVMNDWIYNGINIILRLWVNNGKTNVEQRGDSEDKFVYFISTELYLSGWHSMEWTSKRETVTGRGSQ